MSDPLMAVLAVVLIVGTVLLGVGALAWLGARAAVRPADQRTVRRVARASIIFGVFMLGFHAGAIVYGAGINWLQLFTAIMLIVQGVSMLRNLRQHETNRSA
jgi:apolipoprotein N-acyltransferase